MILYYFDACENKADNFNLTDTVKEFIARNEGIFFFTYSYIISFSIKLSL